MKRETPAEQRAKRREFERTIYRSLIPLAILAAIVCGLTLYYKP